MRNIDIIVRVQGQPDELEVCLASLFRLLPEVAERAPRVTAINPCWERPDIDAVLRMHAGSLPGVEVIMTSEAPGGFGVLSSLLRRSAAERRHALVLTSDTVWFEGGLEALVSVGEAGEGVGLVSPRTSGRRGDAAVRQDKDAPSAAEAHRQFMEIARWLPRHRAGHACLEAAHLVTWPLLAALCTAQPDPADPLPLGPDLAPEARRWAYAALVANRAFIYRRHDVSEPPCRLEAGMAPIALAEAMLGALLPDTDGCVSLVVDWSDTAGHHGDGRGADVPAIRALASEAAPALKVSVMCADAVFRFHGLDKCPGVRHLDPAAPGRHAVALRMHVPDSPAALARFHRLAAITLCVAPPALARLEARGGPSFELWRSMASHANAVLFNSAAEQAYFDGSQHAGQAVSSHLLSRPTALEGHRKGMPLASGGHLLVMGDGADAMADQLQAWFPDMPLVCLGRGMTEAAATSCRRADAVSAESLGALVSRSTAVVLAARTLRCVDSLLPVLAAGKPLVMQRSVCLEEVLESYGAMTGVFLYDATPEVEALVPAAVALGRSVIEDNAAPGWSDWAAAVAALAHRLRDGSTLLGTLAARISSTGEDAMPVQADVIPRAGAVDLDHLLAHEDKDFVAMAYWTFLNREPDAEGKQNFLYALRAGSSKLDVIDMIQDSPEGTMVGASLEGYTPVTASKDALPKRLVVVLGMHRSGTSALTRGLEVLGVDLGSNLYPPRLGENPKGYFEDADITTFDDQLLAAIGRDWQHHGRIDKSQLDHLHRGGTSLRAVELMQAKASGKAVLGVKDPRISKLLGFWQPVFDACQLDHAYVVAIRNPKSVASSLETRNGFAHEKSYMLWLEHTLGSLAVVGKHRFAIVDYDVLLDDPERTIRSVADRLDLYLDKAALQVYVGEFLEEGLRHAEYGCRELAEDSSCFPLVREIYARLRDIALDNALADHQDFQRLIARWRLQAEALQTSLPWVERLQNDNARLRAAMASCKLLATQALDN